MRVPSSATTMGPMDVDDRLLPAAPHLTGPAAAAVIIAPVIEAHGGALIDLRPGQVLYRPGRDLVVSYAARVRWPSGTVDETILAGTTTGGAPEGTVAVEADGMQVGVWRYPFDPALPGLPHATMPGPVAALLGIDPTDLHLEVVAFRPSKRAVVRASWSDGQAYVKVLPPRRAATVLARHEALVVAGVPAPVVLGAEVELGIVGIAALPGVDLRERLLEGGPLPDPGTVLDLVDAIAGADAPAPDRNRPGLLDSARHHAELLRRVHPDVGDRLDAVLADLADVRRVWSPAPIHGDLHEAQIRVGDDGRIVGVLDVDDLGPGDPADDPARAIGHLVALAILHPPSAPRVTAFAAGLHRASVDRHGAEALHPRIAAALVGLATGPYRVQDPDWSTRVDGVLAAAEAWSADDDAHERTLRPAS